jgi:hypothetical protein
MLLYRESGEAAAAEAVLLPEESRASGTEKEVRVKGSAGAAFLEPNCQELLPGRTTD